MKLPSVFANNIDNRHDNNESYYYNKGETPKKDVRELKKYFDKSGFANKLDVELTTKKGRSREKLILYRDGVFINIKNERIPGTDIIDYEIKSDIK